MADVIVVGEVAIDHIFEGGEMIDLRLGGAAYAARAAAASGARVMLGGQVAPDAPPEEVEELRRLGIEYTIIEGRTSRRYVMAATGPGRRRQTYAVAGSAIPLVPDEPADVYVVLAADGLDLAAALSTARRRGARMILDGHAELLEPKWRDVLREVDVLLLNWPTAATLAGGDATRIVDVLGRADRMTVVKQGRGGMTTYHAGQRLETPAVECDLRVKVGAGDTVAGVLGAALAAGTDLEAALRLGALAASVHIQHGLLPYPDLLKAMSGGREVYVPLERLSEPIYIAAPFFTEAQRLALGITEGALGAAQLRYCSPGRDIGVLDAAAGDERRREYFRKDIEALELAPLIVARLDGDDPGTAWEVGYAHARGKPVIAMRSDIRVGLNNMLLQSVELADDLDDLLKRAFRHLAGTR